MSLPDLDDFKLHSVLAKLIPKSSFKEPFISFLKPTNYITTKNRVHNGEESEIFILCK